MRILSPLVSGIATGIGMKLGGDIYDRLKARAAGSDKPLWGGKRDDEAGRPINPWRPGEAQEAEEAEGAEG